MGYTENQSLFHLAVEISFVGKERGRTKTTKTSRVLYCCKDPQAERTGASLLSRFETLRIQKMSWSKWDFPDFAGLKPGWGQGNCTPNVGAQGDMRPLL